MLSKSLFLLVVVLMTALLLVGCTGSETNNQNDQRRPTAVSDAGQAGSSSGDDGTGNASNGATLFQQTCSTCHGANAEGRQGLGPNLVTSDFVQSLDDHALQTFIIEGRPVTHPDNTTGIPMPPRGGNASLTDADILDIVAWIRSL
jgi:mono/diheme cytochrome c family protein